MREARKRQNLIVSSEAKPKRLGIKFLLGFIRPKSKAAIAFVPKANQKFLLKPFKIFRIQGTGKGRFFNRDFSYFSG